MSVNHKDVSWLCVTDIVTPDCTPDSEDKMHWTNSAKFETLQVNCITEYVKHLILILEKREEKQRGEERERERGGGGGGKRSGRGGGRGRENHSCCLHHVTHGVTTLIIVIMETVCSILFEFHTSCDYISNLSCSYQNLRARKWLMLKMFHSLLKQYHIEYWRQPRMVEYSESVRFTLVISFCNCICNIDKKILFISILQSSNVDQIFIACD